MKKSSNSTTKRQPSESTSSLSEIREALQKVDNQRLVPDISEEEREALELSAVALRDAERLAVSLLQKEIIKDMEALTKPLNDMAKEIREKVKKINKVPKALDVTGKVLKEVVRVLLAVGKWK